MGFLGSIGSIVSEVVDGAAQKSEKAFADTWSAAKSSAGSMADAARQSPDWGTHFLPQRIDLGCWGTHPYTTADPAKDVSSKGFHPNNDFPPGKNDFRIRIDGPDPNLAVGGSHDQQEQQREDTLKLDAEAQLSYVTGNLPLPGPREPSDSSVANTLKGLSPNPPIGRDGTQVTHAIYTSHIPNATPEQAYRHFVQDPQAVFGAGGMEIRPAPGDAGLKDGGKYMLESGGPPPVWLPIQVGLNPSKNQITIHTLDGHVLRGVQTFTFTSDGHGGSVLTQDAHFQASSSLIGSAQNIASVSHGQHESWYYAHQEIYQYFNGNPGYKGLGTGLSGGNLRNDLNAVIHAVTHPGDTLQGLLGTFGSVLNAATDETGELLGDAMRAAHLPGSGVVTHVFDKVGDIWEKGFAMAGDIEDKVADTAGSIAKGAIDTAGSIAKDAIHDLNPANWHL